MNCPTCPDSTLVMTERSSVEIDYCPTCRGIWLDRGELDKIIERDATPPRREPDRSDERRLDRDRFDDRGRYDNDDDRDDERRDSGSGRKRRKRESLLSELFDF